MATPAKESKPDDDLTEASLPVPPETERGNSLENVDELGSKTVHVDDNDDDTDNDNDSDDDDDKLATALRNHLIRLGLGDDKEFLDAVAGPRRVVRKDGFTPFRFLDLPAEIRYRVYDICEAFWVPKNMTNPADNTRKTWVSLRQGLRLVCRQIGHEWRPHFLRTSTLMMTENFNPHSQRARHAYAGPMDLSHCDFSGWLKTCPKDVTADSVLEQFNQRDLEHLGSFEQTLFLSDGELNTILYSRNECWCTDPFRFGRMHVEQRWPGKLLVGISCCSLCPEGWNVKSNFDRLLLIDKADPKDYVAVMESMRNQWLDAAWEMREILEEMPYLRLGQHEYCKVWGCIKISFKTVPLNFELSEVHRQYFGRKAIAEGITMVESSSFGMVCSMGVEPFRPSVGITETNLQDEAGVQDDADSGDT